MVKWLKWKKHALQFQVCNHGLYNVNSNLTIITLCRRFCFFNIYFFPLGICIKIGMMVNYIAVSGFSCQKKKNSPVSKRYLIFKKQILPSLYLCETNCSHWQLPNYISTFFCNPRKQWNVFQGKLITFYALPYLVSNWLQSVRSIYLSFFDSNSYWRASKNLINFICHSEH